MTELTNPYPRLIEIGAQIDNHESDLYVLATPEVLAIVKASGYFYQAFRSELDGKTWLDVPFAFLPFWEAKQGKAA